MKKLCVILISAFLFFQSNGMDFTEDTCDLNDSENKNVEIFTSQEGIQNQEAHDCKIEESDESSQEESANDFQEEESPCFNRKHANTRRYSANSRYHEKSKVAWIRKNVAKSGVPQKDLSKTVKRLLSLTTK